MKANFHSHTRWCDGRNRILAVFFCIAIGLLCFMCDGRCDDASDVELALSSVIQTIRVNPTNGVDVKIAKWGDGALLVDLATTNKIGWIQEAVRVCGEAEYVLGEGKSY